MGREQRRLREKTERKQKAKEVSSLASHKRDGKDLVPQLMTTGKIQFSSWMNTRMPEMLWAVLLVSELEREEALRFLRLFSERLATLPVEDQPKDLYLTDLAAISTDSLKEALEFTISKVPNATRVLQPLLLFPNLPAKDLWESVLPSLDGSESEVLVKAVSKVLDHQSQEATDCRWVRVAYSILCKKIMFPESMAELLHQIMEYPNKGDMRQVRPTIRAMEISQGQMREHNNLGNEESAWVEHFWEVGIKATPCLIGERIHPPETVDLKKFQEEIESLRAEVSDAFLTTQTTSAIDPRHDGSFGLVLYALDVASEISQPVIHNGTLGRIGLRTIVETYILLSYLVNQDDLKKWGAYRNYGSGQAKLAFLKLLDTESLPDFVDMEALESLANEDVWQEFVTIKIGNWDTSNLRKMSEVSGEKGVYDSFYDWTSGYIHGQWAVVRDTTLTNCLNPLHRLHRVPKKYVDYRASVLDDVRTLINAMIDKLKIIYLY